VLQKCLTRTIDDSITGGERVNRGKMKVVRHQLLGSVGGVIAVSVYTTFRLNYRNISDFIFMLIIMVATLLLLYLGALNFYRYLLVKVHCPDLNVRNSAGEVEIFAEMEERNHLDIDNPESKD